MINLLLYENNSLFKESIISLIEERTEYNLQNAFEDCTNVLEDIRMYKPDVLLLDMHMIHCDCLEAIKLIKRENNSIKILMLVIFEDDPNIFKAIRYGASGYLVKKTAASRLPSLINNIYTGNIPVSTYLARHILQTFGTQADKKSRNILTALQSTILLHLSNGFSYKMIALELEVPIQTISEQVQMVYEKIHQHHSIKVG